MKLLQLGNFTVRLKDLRAIYVREQRTGTPEFEERYWKRMGYFHLCGRAVLPRWARDTRTMPSTVTVLYDVEFSVRQGFPVRLYHENMTHAAAIEEVRRVKALWAEL